MGEELNFDKKIYVLPKIKWYKKLWYIITRQKDKIPKPIELNSIEELVEAKEFLDSLKLK